jgi:hypothetical protein
MKYQKGFMLVNERINQLGDQPKEEKFLDLED